MLTRLFRIRDIDKMLFQIVFVKHPQGISAHASKGAGFSKLVHVIGIVWCDGRSVCPWLEHTIWVWLHIPGDSDTQKSTRMIADLGMSI